VNYARPDWIITNPPFHLAERFIIRAMEIGSPGIAMLVRTTFLEGVGRYERLFKYSPPAIVAQFTERLVILKGRLSATGSTATSYCWLVFQPGNAERGRLMWIPPCRKALTRPGDYPEDET
jgi:hypothetical protein